MVLSMPEHRFNPLRRQWVILAPDRAQRPNAYTAEQTEARSACPFCPGNEEQTPPQITIAPRIDDPTKWQVRVVPNRYPVLVDGEEAISPPPPLYSYRPAHGAHEVVVDSPEHEATLASLKPFEGKQLLRVFGERLKALYERDDVRYAIVFKNFGAAAGASAAHPHTQIVGTTVLPPLIEQELATQDLYWEENARCLLCELVSEEITAKTGVVTSTDEFIAFCPYASRVNFEVWITSIRHERDFFKLSNHEHESLARLLIDVARRLEIVAKDLAYNLILQSPPPSDVAAEIQARHWRIEILPRTTGIAGLELGTGLFLSTVAPERAAETLRRL